MVKNIGWIAGSRGFNSVVSVAYLAVAARTLGPAQFGAFALILTYAQLVANFVQFQSWKGVIRYGALHVTAERPDRLERLFGFTATLDFGSAIIGSLIAMVGVPLVAPLLHWQSHEQTSAALFAGILLLTTGATPSGMLRLFDRFGLAAMGEAVGPLVRLAGSLAAWATGAGAETFLIIWVVAAVAQASTQWLAVIVINRSRIAFGRRAFNQAIEENEGLWRFMLQTNLSNSVTMFWTQLGTLAIGAVSGPADAGAFRLAKGLSKGIARPIQPITLALYPELSRMVADDDHSQLRKVTLQVTFVATGLALLVVLVTGLFGREILHLLAGRRFEFAEPFLFLLSVAAAIDLAGFAFEPLQNAYGQSWNVLRAKLIAAGAYVLMLGILLPTMGARGAAIAAILCSLLIFIQLAVLTARSLPKRPGVAAGVGEADGIQLGE